MGSLSVSNCRGLFHWEGLLVVVLFLTFWSPPSTATIEVMSTFATKGDDVLLQIKNKPPVVAGVEWYKGMGVDHNNIIAFYIIKPHFHLSGPEFNGEQMITDDGSLLLKNVTEKDAGMYTVVVHFPDSETQTGFGRLDVYGIGGLGEKRSCSRTTETSPWTPAGKRTLGMSRVCQVSDPSVLLKVCLLEIDVKYERHPSPLVIKL